MRRMLVLLALLVSALVSAASAEDVNGKLQIDFMNVNQGDGALLVSFGDETVCFDDGFRGFSDWRIAV